ncbi:MAG TPA: cupin domain-containing protein [Actinomycetes bacterium]|nr:cupin domain-containing protein [Actinomycetes bacterium]
MPASGVPQVGQRIREERLKRGLSLRGLARGVGVSASLVSQIETGKSQPSVSTLYAITSALGISVQDVFEAAAGTVTDLDATLGHAVGETGPPTTVLQALSALPPDRLGPVVHEAERQVLRLDSGVTWERLGRLPPHDVDFLLVTYAPGGSSSSTGTLMRHAGSEYGMLLRGELVLTLAFEEMTLRAGDSISFESSTPHRYRNDGSQEAVGVWFVSG